MKKHFRLLGVAALATTMLTGCSNDELVETNQGEAIAFRARTETRATDLTLDNLGDFKVYAKGMHPSGDLYTEFIIGSASDAEIAKKNTTGTNTNIWDLNRNVYWPSGMDQILFWAYTTDDNSSNANAIDLGNTATKVTFERTGPKIASFTPVKSSLSETSETGKWADGYKQKDLLIAFTEQKKEDGTQVTLKFDHALSKINIKATHTQDSKDHRIVTIKGAWIVNAKTTGDLTAGFEWNKEEKKATHDIQWQNQSTFGTYGSYSNVLYSFTKTTQTTADILGSNGELMLIPQTTPGIIFNTDNDPNTYTDGAYILLLCRVELLHDGDNHNNQANTDDILIENGKHYHQLFPALGNDEKFNRNQYGFSCVPLNIDWKKGTQYTYNLNICCNGSGAGVYPPKVFSEDELKQLIPDNAVVDATIEKPKPLEIIQNINSITHKEAGDPVLDLPITFDVKVSKWTNAANNSDKEEDATIDTSLQ